MMSVIEFHLTDPGVDVRPASKLAAALVAAGLALAGCTGNGDEDNTITPLTKAGVTVDPSQLPTLTGAFGELPTIAFPLREGQSSPAPTPSDEVPPPEGESETPESSEPPPADDAPTGDEEAPADGEGDQPAEGEENAEPEPSETPSPYIAAPSELQAQVQDGMAGTGETVKENNLVSVDLAIWEWGKTEAVMETFTEADRLVFPVRSDVPTYEGLARVVFDQKVGSRLLGIIPPSEGTLVSDLNLGLDAGATLVVVVDIREQFSKDLEAQKDAAPTGAKIDVRIEGGLGEAATLTVPSGTAEPTKVSATVIATGTGPAVKDADQVLVHYVATDWMGDPAGSTWVQDRGPQPIVVRADPSGDQSTVTAFSELVGVPVGSRVLILLPGKAGSYLPVAVLVDIVKIVEGHAQNADTSDDAENGEEGDGTEGDNGEGTPDDGAEGDSSAPPAQ
ncbi:MAG: hypothetical protein LBH68_03650 [Bifidobacteriaceae bacterium]|nr:hypothetical protein [Bifidobacteriaceae bacterium]